MFDKVPLQAIFLMVDLALLRIPYITRILYTIIRTYDGNLDPIYDEL